MSEFESSAHEHVWRQGRRYLAGRLPEDATATVAELAGRSIAANIGWLTQVATDEWAARSNAKRYRVLASSLARQPATTWLEVDLPHIGLEVSTRLCAQQLGRIAERLPAGRFIQVGAEDSDHTDRVLDTVLAAHRAGVPIRATIQANLRRSAEDVDRLTAAGVPIRLVKGGFPEPLDRALPFGTATDDAFLALAKQILAAGTGLTLATHDRRLRASLWPEAGSIPVEMLLGVCSGDVDSLVAEGHQVRLFVPFGTDWFDYLAKRISDAEKAGVAT